MDRLKNQIVETEECLRQRLVGLLGQPPNREVVNPNQLTLFEDLHVAQGTDDVIGPRASIFDFLNFLCSAMPNGELYLFGGILRDLAWYGRRGFNSDIDLVVHGERRYWKELVEYIDSGCNGVGKNKFGGFRLKVGEWPIDVWYAEDTWAIRKGLVKYHGIGSLTKTTILNWDAILLNWRTKKVVCAPYYFQQLREGLIDIVLEENPNPLGAVVRAFRYVCLNDAKALTPSAANFLNMAARKYSAEIIIKSEVRKYGDTVIYPTILTFFKKLDTSSDATIRRQFRGVSQFLQARID